MLKFEKLNLMNLVSLSLIEKSLKNCWSSLEKILKQFWSSLNIFVNLSWSCLRIVKNLYWYNPQVAYINYT